MCRCMWRAHITRLPLVRVLPLLCLRLRKQFIFRIWKMTSSKRILLFSPNTFTLVYESLIFNTIYFFLYIFQWDNIKENVMLFPMFRIFVFYFFPKLSICHPNLSPPPFSLAIIIVLKLGFSFGTHHDSMYYPIPWPFNWTWSWMVCLLARHSLGGIGFILLVSSHYHFLSQNPM